MGVNLSLFVYQGTPYVAYQNSNNGIDVGNYDPASQTWPLVGGASAGLGVSNSSVSLFVDQGTPYVSTSPCVSTCCLSFRWKRWIRFL